MPAKPLHFPDPETHADGDGVVAWSRATALTPELLLAAYRSGVFPWPVGPGSPIPWTSPDPRAILEFSHLNVPRTLRQAQRRVSWTFTIDRAFPRVIESCARARRPGQDGTWITPSMIRAYVQLHRLGHAHSVEVWDQGDLVGGLYGVDSGGAFTGESMFHLRDNASKLAFLHLVEHLASRGLDWVDIQQMTPHFAVLGAREIPRTEFLRRLRATLSRQGILFDAISGT